MFEELSLRKKMSKNKNLEPKEITRESHTEFNGKKIHKKKTSFTLKQFNFFSGLTLFTVFSISAFGMYLFFSRLVEAFLNG